MTTRVTLHNAAFRELRTLDAVWHDLETRGERMADACDGEVLVNEKRRSRAGVTVAASDAAALLSALGAGRG